MNALSTTRNVPTKIELPHFSVGTAYGGSQDWCESRWMKLGGCAAVTACDSAIYFTLFKGRQGLYPYPTEKISRREYVSFTDVMKPYLRPRWGGIDRLETYIEGFGRFLSARGERALRMKPWPGESSLPETKAAVKKQIDSGWLIPCLTLRHSHPSMEDYDWHWYLLNGYEERDGKFFVKAVTFGAWRWLDLTVLWDTGHKQKGGLILYDLS